MEVKTICPHCGLLCDLTLLKEREILGTVPSPLCVKGLLAWTITYDQSRIYQPMMRKGRKHATIHWKEAVETMRRKIKNKGALTFVVSGSCTEEELAWIYSLSNSLGAPMVTTDPVLSASIFCKQATISDLETADVIFILGELLEFHPVLAGQILRSKYERGTRLFCLSSRLGPSSWFSETLQPLPGGESLVLLHMAQMLIQQGTYKKEQEKIPGFPEFRSTLKALPPVDRAGIKPLALSPVVDALAKAKKPLFVVTPSVTKTDNWKETLLSLSNLALLLDCGVLIVGGLEKGLRKYGVEEYDGKRKKVAFIFRSDPRSVDADFKILFTPYFVEEADLLIPIPCFTELSGTLTDADGGTKKLNKISDPPQDVREVGSILSEVVEELRPSSPPPKKPLFEFKEVKEKINVPRVSAGFPFLLYSQPTYFNFDWVKLKKLLDRFLDLKDSFELNPEDAERLGIKEGAEVMLRTEKEEFKRMALVRRSVPPGVIYLPDFKTCVAAVV
ncbi:MAG: molybdopterin-dependent oxidoreductase [Candidatus Hadarchaeales archaeon]